MGILSPFKCLFCCMESVFFLLSDNAYIMCAVHGKSFCGSASDAFDLLQKRFYGFVVLNKITATLFFAGIFFITIGSGMISYFYFMYMTNDDVYAKVAASITAFGTYFLTNLIFDIFSMAVDTIFLCVCKQHLKSLQMTLVFNCCLFRFSGRL